MNKNRNERLSYLIKLAQQSIRNRMDKVLTESGITTPQYAVLSALEIKQTLSNAELAKECFVTAQTMIRIIQNLEEMELVKKKAHEINLKIIQIELTDRGRRVLKKTHQSVLNIEKMITSDISNSEQEIVSKSLLKIIQKLK